MRNVPHSQVKRVGRQKHLMRCVINVLSCQIPCTECYRRRITLKEKQRKAIPSVTSIKDNANRNISHSGTCTGLKRKWTPIASDRDIAQLVRIAPRFRSERAWNPASHWAKKAKNRRAKASRTEGSLARGKSTARRFFAVSPRLVKPVV